jgi:Protein of Unknown function (DUF2784)
MAFRVLADATVLVHAAFVVFVVCGGLLVARWPRIASVHLPAVVWAAWVELAGWTCPLTPLENWLRSEADDPIYTSSFVEHYLLPILYPSALSRPLQWVLGGLVLLINLTVYTVVLWRRAHGGRGR